MENTNKLIFISYSRNDEKFAIFLAEELKKKNVNVWLDQIDISVGENWDDAIQQALEKCEYIIVVLSSSSVESENVKDEIVFSIKNKKNIIPILYENCNIPLKLARRQYIDFTRNFDKGIAKILEFIKINDISNDSIRMKDDFKISIRNSPKKNLLSNEVRFVLKKNNFYNMEYEWNKDWANPTGKGINHVFNVAADKLTVFDETTDLMWQLSGSEKKLTYKKAIYFINQLNLDKFAGYTDWRLPTLEEAMSLMEPKKNESNLHIAPIFDRKQYWIWSADRNSVSLAWDIDYYEGSCHYYFIEKSLFVRAVRNHSP